MRSLVYKSNSLKFWLSFFQKGVYALQTILCCKALDKEIYFLLKPFFYFLIFVDQGFGYHNGNGGFLRYNLSHFFCLCHQFFIFHHPVDKPDGCCLFCIDNVTCKNHFLCLPYANESAKPLCTSKPWNKAEVHFRLTKFCSFTRYSYITGK